MPPTPTALPDALDKQSRRSRTPSPRKGRGSRGSKEKDTGAYTTPRSISPNKRDKTSPYRPRSSEFVRGELRGELKQDPKTRFPVMATSLPPTDTRPGVYEWRLGLQDEASISGRQRDYCDEEMLSHVNYPTAPEAMTISRSNVAAEHARQDEQQQQQPPQQPQRAAAAAPNSNAPTPGLPPIRRTPSSPDMHGSGRCLSPQLLSLSAPPTNVRSKTRQAGTEFYVIPQIDMPNIKIKVRGNSAKPKRPMSGMDPRRSSVLTHDWEAALRAANGKYNEPRPPAPHYLAWVKDGTPLPTWYVYGIQYDPEIWTDAEQLDGRTANFTVYERVFGVKPDLGPRDSAKVNWKKIQTALKIDVEAANWKPHPEIFDRIQEIKEAMRQEKLRFRRRSIALRTKAARELLAGNMARLAITRGVNAHWMLQREERHRLEREAEARRAAAYAAHMARLALEEARLDEEERLRGLEEEAARKAAAEASEADRLESERRLAELHAQHAAATAAAAAAHAKARAEAEAEEAARIARLRAIQDEFQQFIFKRKVKAMGHRWLLKTRASMARRETEERAARIQLKMLKMQAEIDADYNAAVSAGVQKITELSTQKTMDEELAIKAQSERETKQIVQIRKACKATVRWLEDKGRTALPGRRQSKDLLINDAFSLPEEMVIESSQKSIKVDKGTSQLEERLTKKEMAYITAQREKIHMMAENEQIPNAHGEKRPHIVLLSNKWQVTDMVLDPETIKKFEAAVRAEHPIDGSPIRLITYDWEIKAEDLMKKIKHAVKGTSRKLTDCDPEYFLKAKSITFMVKHDDGTLFVTKDQMTSMTTLSIPCQDNVKVRRWWSKLYDLLTCCGEEIVTGKVVGSRWNVQVNMLGYTLDNTIYGETLEAVIATLLNCDVRCTVDKATYGNFFDMVAFKEAAQTMKNEKRSHAIGYDITNKDMTITVRGKIKRKQESFAQAW